MARIRTIKPEFWSSEQVVDCSPTARLLFIGLWNFCDDGGNHPYSVKTIKARVFPADTMGIAEIQAMLDELIANRLLTPYEADGAKYLNVSGWKHQKIEKPSYKYPRPGSDHSPTIRRPLDDGPPAEGKGRESKGREESENITLSSAQLPRETKTPQRQHGEVRKAPEQKSTMPAQIKKPEPIPDNEARANFEKNTDKEIMAMARRVRPHLWAQYGLAEKLVAYETAGGVEDLKLCARWLKNGYSAHEIIEANRHAAMSAETPSNPVTWFGSTIPKRIELFRKTGQYFDQRAGQNGAESTQVNSQSTKVNAPLKPSEMAEKDREDLRRRTESYVRMYLKNSGRNWQRWKPEAYGPAPGTPDSVISAARLHEIEIEEGIRGS